MGWSLVGSVWGGGGGRGGCGERHHTSQPMKAFGINPRVLRALNKNCVGGPLIGKKIKLQNVQCGALN